MLCVRPSNLLTAGLADHVWCWVREPRSRLLCISTIRGQSVSRTPLPALIDMSWMWYERHIVMLIPASLPRGFRLCRDAYRAPSVLPTSAPKLGSTTQGLGRALLRECSEVIRV